MNRIERLSHSIGKIIGLYKKGIESAFSTSGTRPLLSDDTAWGDPQFWGRALEDNKPRTKRDFISYFRSWFYICAKLNGQGVASTALRLYTTKESKEKQYRTVKTRAVDKMQLKWLQGNAGLDSWLTKAADVEEVTEHPLLALLKNVNPYNNRFDLWELTSLFPDLTGEAYWYLPAARFEESRIPQQIWVIPSQFINPKFGTSLNKAIEYYDYERGNVKVKIPTEDVIMFTYPNPNNTFTGFSVVRGIADEAYIHHQMNEFETALIENRARVGGIIEETENIGDTERQRIKQKLKQDHSGPKKAGKDLYLPKGLKYQRDTMTPEEISFIEGLKLYRTVIMAALDIPEGMFITESSNRAVSEAAIYLHAKFGILPRCRRIEEKLNEKLVPRYDEKLFVAFDNPVPEDKEFLLKKQEMQVKTNIIQINEARSDEGRDPVDYGDTGWFDSRLVPVSGKEDMIAEEQVEEFARRVRNAMKEMLK